jgi:hypothetical protein
MNQMKIDFHIDTKMKKTTTARQQVFENSILRELSRFERVQIETTMSNEMINSKTVLAVHRADSVSSRIRRRDRERDKERERSSVRKRRNREREQAVSKEI